MLSRWIIGRIIGLNAVRITVPLVGFAVCALGLVSVHAGEGRERHSLLSPPEGAPFPHARGQVEITSEAFFLKVEGLGAGTYGVTLDDGTGTLQRIADLLVEAEEGEDDGKGDDGEGDDGEGDDGEGDDGEGGHEENENEGPSTRGVLRLAGGELPFGVSSPLDLGGRALQVKDASDAVVLQGKTPSPITEEPKEHVGECPLLPPEAAADSKVEGSLRLEQGEARVVIKVNVHRLNPETVYSIVFIHPEEGTSETVGMLTTGGDGGGKFKLDTASGNAIPFGAPDLASLVGFKVEIRNPEGTAVLAGTVCPAKPRGDDGNGGDPPGADEECEANLSRPEGAPDADAEGEVEIEGEEIEVEVELLADGAYDVFLIDPAEGGAAVNLGQVVPIKAGHGELEFQAQEGVALPFGKTSMAEFVGFRVEVRDAEGKVVLSGTLPATACKAEEEDGKHEDDGKEDDGNEDDGKEDGEGDHGGDGDGKEGDGAGLPPADEPMFRMIGPFDAPFLRGDSNRDSQIDLTDAVHALSYLFAGGVRPYCLDAADANDDGLLDITDPIAVLSFLFMGGDRPAAPGVLISSSDPTADALYCEEAPAP